MAALAAILLGCGAGLAGRPAAFDDPAARAIAFDAQRAFEHVRRLVELGPRPPGTDASRQAQEYIAKELKSYGLKVTADAFRATTPRGAVGMVNIIGELPGEKGDVIILGSHYDTKLFKEFRFVGANDGGSSTGALLEVARALARQPRPKFTLQFVFFDGEEAFCREWDECLGGRDHTYGSRRFAEMLRLRNEVARVKAMVLLDMIGDKKLLLYRDRASTSWLTDIIWRTGEQLGYGRYFSAEYQDVGGDDHYPFLELGVPATDLIHFFDTWHTAQDRLENISPESLKVVGETIIRSLPAIAAEVEARSASAPGGPKK